MRLSILPNVAELKERRGKWDKGENFCVFCVGKVKPLVLNSQFNIGQLPLKVVCVAFSD